MDTSSDMYGILGKVNAQRKASQIWSHEFVQRYAASNFYAFSRGEFHVALTNHSNDVAYQVTYTPFAEGETVCNIFNPTTDCQVVSNGVNVYLAGGESKIYVPQSQLHASLFEEEIAIEMFQ